LAEAIKAKFGVDSEMIEGSGGVFDIRVDGDLIYSKKETGEFPEHQLILDLLAKRGAGG
jgi:selenoprotein W-related protein